MDSYLHSSETSCLCGDVNGTSIVDIADVVYFASYLYAEGPFPPDPIERADVNNNRVVDGADLVYLANYCFCYGSPPECCWIH